MYLSNSLPAMKERPLLTRKLV